MKKAGIVVLLSVVFLFTALQQNEAKSRDFYRTFEIIAIGENSLTLRDSDNNVIEVAKDHRIVHALGACFDTCRDITLVYAVDTHGA